LAALKVNFDSDIDAILTSDQGKRWDAYPESVTAEKLKTHAGQKRLLDIAFKLSKNLSHWAEDLAVPMLKITPKESKRIIACCDVGFDLRKRCFQ
jgi:hypothetical protein